jgi:signal transduction histidine kinase
MLARKMANSQSIPLNNTYMQADTQADDAASQNDQHAASAEAEDAANRLETEFLAVISHELRSPLAAIKGSAATLRRHGRRLGHEEQDAFLRAIVESSDRLETLIARLLLLAQLEAGSLKPRLVPVDMARLAREAVLAGARRWAAEGRTIEGPEQETSPLVLVDLRLLRDVLDILLENAVKYSPAGSAVAVSLRAEGESLFVGVRDHGIGISAAHLHRIFDRFYRVDTRLTREHDGAGIGLAICKRIVELHGGEIWAESVPGVGSMFWMRLPLAPIQSEHEFS